MKTKSTVFVFLISLCGVALGGDKPSTGVPTAKKAPVASRQQAWQRAWERLEQADKESIEAINDSLREVDGSFATAATNIPQFVDDVLGWYGKWQFARGISEQALNMGAGMVDAIFTTKLSSPPGKDSFRDFSRKQFSNAVFDPEVFKRGIDRSAASYATRLQAIENRLLIDLKLDLPNSRIVMPRIATPKLSDELLTAIDSAVDYVISDAATDFGVTILKEFVSQVGGNIAAGAVLSGNFLASHGMSNDPFSAAVLGTGLVTGLGVSWAVDKAVEAMGHNPKGTLSKKLVDRLKSVRLTMTEGTDPQWAGLYCWLSLFRSAHASEAVRIYCGKAADKVEGGTFLGVRPLLSALHSERMATRRRLVYRSIFGAVDEPTGLCLDPNQLSQTDALIRIAGEILSK